MVESAFPANHPVGVAKIIGEKIARGNAQLYRCNQDIVEQFLSMKLALPAASDECIASLLVASALHDEINVTTLDVG